MATAWQHVPMNNGALESWHYAPGRGRVAHTLGMIVRGTLRRFVFRWEEELGKRELVLDEGANGEFEGVLGFLDARVSTEWVTAKVVERGGREWEITVARPNQEHALTIHATST